MFNKKLLGLAVGSALLMAAHSSFAQMSSATASYDILLGNVCVVTATGQSFGNYPTGTGALIGIAGSSVDVTCPAGVNYIWGLGGGNNYGLGFSPMYPAMTDGAGNYISYTPMYATWPVGDATLNAIDPTYVVTSMSASGVGGVGTAAPQNYALLTDVYLQTTEPAGAYNDTLAVTVVWP